MVAMRGPPVAVTSARRPVFRPRWLGAWLGLGPRQITGLDAPQQLSNLLLAPPRRHQDIGTPAVQLAGPASVVVAAEPTAGPVLGLMDDHGLDGEGNLRVHGGRIHGIVVH